MIIIPNGNAEYIEIDDKGTTRRFEDIHDGLLHSDTTAAVVYASGAEEFWFHGIQYEEDYWIDYAFNGMTPKRSIFDAPLHKG